MCLGVGAGLSAFHLPEHAKEAVHVQGLEEDVNVGRRDFAAEFAEGDVAGIGEDGNFGGAL